MAVKMPVTELDARFSSRGAGPTDWAEGRQHIENAEVFWLSTVRPDGRPHVTPLLSVWHEDAMYFCTGPKERKAKNLKQYATPHFTAGQNGLDDGLDVVVEGHAVEVANRAEYIRVAKDSQSGTARASQHRRARGLVSATRSDAVRRSSIGSLRGPFSASPRVSSSARPDGALLDRATTYHAPEN